MFTESCIVRWTTDHRFNCLSPETEIHGIIVPCLVLKDTGKHWGAMQGWKSSEKYCFEESLPAKKQPVGFPKRGERVPFQVAYDDPHFVRLQQIVFGHSFEKLRLLAQAKWGSRRNWPNLVQFGYHVRNGSFHGNKFNFTAPINGNPSWRSASITMKMQGLKVMGGPDGLLGLADIPVLLHDLCKVIESRYRPK